MNNKLLNDLKLRIERLFEDREKLKEDLVVARDKIENHKEIISSEIAKNMNKKEQLKILIKKKMQDGIDSGNVDKKLIRDIEKIGKELSEHENKLDLKKERDKVEDLCRDIKLLNKLERLALDGDK